MTGGGDGRVYYATLDGQDQSTTTQPDDPLTALTLTLDGRVVTASVNGRVHCGRLRDGALTLIAQHDYPVTHLLLTGDGRALTGGEDGRVICSRLDGGGRVELVRHRGIVTELRLLGAGRFLTQGQDGKVWCARLDGSDLRLIADRSASRILAVTKDERVVSLVEDDNSARMYCARIEGGEAELIAALDGRVSTLALSPDGRIVTGSDDGRIYCTPLATGVPILLASHPKRVDQLMPTGDGRVLTPWCSPAASTSIRWRRRSSFKYSRYFHSSRLASRAPRPSRQRGLTPRCVWSDGRMCCARLEGGDLLELATLAFMRQPLLDGAGNVVYVTGARAETVCIVGLDGGPPGVLLSTARALRVLS